MDSIALLLILLIGLVCWGGWPLVAQASDISDPYVRGFLLNAVTLVGFLPFMPGRITGTSLLSTGALLMVLAGLLNLAGHILFPKLQTMTGVQISISMAMIPALCIITSSIGGTLFFGDPLTTSKIVFTALIVIGIVGLALTST